jgi:ribonuclease D
MSDFLTPPSKMMIAGLERFAGIGLDQITVVQSTQEAESAYDDLKRAKEVGFDTESKPTFVKGQKSDGPHVLQFATSERVYIFQTHLTECEPTIIRLLKSSEIIKIGFDLKGDMSHILRRFGIQPVEVMDLDRSFRRIGYRTTVGAKSAIAILLNQRLIKSKSITTSNWANRVLSESQLIYAANDAYVALLVHRMLKEAGHLNHG